MTSERRVGRRAREWEVDEPELQERRSHGASRAGRAPKLWPALLLPGMALVATVTRRALRSGPRARRLRRILGLRSLHASSGVFLRRSMQGLAGVTGTALALGVARWQLDRRFTETPSYEIERRIGDVEIRRYPSRVVAETSLDGDDWERALSEGFARIAEYVFGKNQGARRMRLLGPNSPPPPGESWGRWRDRSLRPGARAVGERLPMTTPVTIGKRGSRLVVGFGMPEGRGLMSLPTPLDARVVLRAIPATTVAVLRFRGGYRATRVRPMEERLLERVRTAGLSPIGEPLFAGYDPPTTVPFLRRLEVWVPLAIPRRR